MPVTNIVVSSPLDFFSSSDTNHYYASSIVVFGTPRTNHPFHTACLGFGLDYDKCCLWGDGSVLL